MAHTNSTTNYSLPQFITTDKPAWLTDINGAFSDIDTGMHTAQTKADSAYNDAATAQGDATTALTNAAAADAKGSGALASIEATFDPTTIYSVGAKVIYNSLLYRCTVAVVTPGPWTGSSNWERVQVDNLIASVDSKVGSLGSLATTDKTSAVNAINEVYGKIYDYGTSGAVPNICTINAFYGAHIGHIFAIETEVTLTSAAVFNTTILSTPLLPKLTNVPIQAYSPDLGSFVNLIIDLDGNIRAISNIASGTRLRIAGAIIV